MIMNKICRYCKIKQARKGKNGEHIIVASRLREINSFKTECERNDNIQKGYKITCENCNNLLGEYERERWSNLTYATVWKILASNVNSVFRRHPDFIIENTPPEIIEKYEFEFLKLIKGDGFLPKNTFSFSFDPNKSELKKKFGIASQKIKLKSKDENGNSIQGATFYTKDKGGGEKEVGYQVSSDERGIAEIDVLTRIELVRVVKEKLILTNSESDEIQKTTIDIIIYISFNSNSHRLVFILPLIGTYNTGWNNVTIKANHKGFLKIIQDNFPEIAFTEINEYFKNYK